MKRSSIFGNNGDTKEEPPRVRQPEVKVEGKDTVVLTSKRKPAKTREVAQVQEVQQHIVPTKSIDKVEIDAVKESVVSINKKLPVQKCHVIDFSKYEHTDTALIRLKSFYPDSRIAIIDDLTLDVSYAAYLDDETYIFTESAMIDPVVVAVLSKGVVVNVGDKTYLITKEGFTPMTPLPKKEEEELATEVKIEGKVFSSHSTQNKLPDINDDITSYYYDDVRYDLYPDGRLIEYNLEEKRRLLLADTNGCYVALYIVLNDEEYHTIDDKQYKVLGRITKTFCLLEERESKVHYALSVRGTDIMELGKISNKLPTLAKSKYNGISNGVPMLTKHNKLARDLTLTVFTPQVRRIIISKDSFVDTNYISNGVYLPDEEILVMHDGAIIFAEEKGQTLTILKTGKVIHRNHGHLGDLDD